MLSMLMLESKGVASSMYWTSAGYVTLTVITGTASSLAAISVMSMNRFPALNSIALVYNSDNLHPKEKHTRLSWSLSASVIHC